MAAETTALKIPISLPIGGDCPRCVDRLRESLLEMRGIDALQVDTEDATMTLSYDPNLVSLEQVEDRAHRAGVEIAGRFGHETFDLVGLDCPDCAVKLERAVGSIAGVLWASVSYAASVLHVEYEDGDVLRDAVMRRVETLGYTTRQAMASGRRAPAGMGRRTILTAVSGVLLVAGAAVSFVAGDPLFAIGLYVLAIVAGGYYLAKGAFYSLATRSLDMNVLMTVAVLGAAFIGDWAEGATVVFLFAVGNALEALAADRTRASIRGLIELAPSTALIRRDGREQQLATCKVRIGDVMIVRPGERISMDGVVTDGSSTVNQAPITGESVSVDKTAGDPVFAGSINEAGALEVEVTRLAEDNTIARIIHLVEDAQAQKAPSQRFVDRFSRYYTPTVIAMAILLAAVPPLAFGADSREWLYRALVMLVISCPCALVISTPVSIVSAIGNASRRGVLIKGGVHLEQAAAVSAIAFDKTGTLTIGRPEVTDVVASAGATEDEVLAAAAAVECRSEHPLAEAILAEAGARGITPGEGKHFRAIVGRGALASVGGTERVVGSPAMFQKMSVEAGPLALLAERLQEEGKTVVMVGSRDGVIGLVAMADRLRAESARALGALREAGVSRVVMLTGDNERTAAAIAEDLPIDEYFAELMPQDKVETIKRMRDGGTAVAMVGDGVNDAPALAAASVGMAMGTAASDTALETADIALMSDDLTKIPFVLRLSRRALRTVKQNVAAALVIKGVFMLVTALGLTSLWLAVLADTGTSLLVTANGLRLLRTKVEL